MILKQLKLVKGLRYIEDFISEGEKETLLRTINSHPWCSRLRRQQQYYGIKYFQTKLPDPILQPSLSEDHLPLPSLSLVIDKAISAGIFDPKYPPNQILVNKYKKSHVLGLHVEDTSAFGDIIAGVSLGSTDYLRLMNTHDKSQQYFLQLKDRSCYVLTEEARLNYRHGIARTINKQTYKDQNFQRISLTIRHVIDSRRQIPPTLNHTEIEQRI